MTTNLAKIDHIVVLMMENRSFDHMLGYLKLDHGLDVEGLSGTESNPDLSGLPVRVQPLIDTCFPTDPGHTFNDVQEQLADGNGGFVKNYLSQKEHATPPAPIMGYYRATQLWAYDYLARAFAICDHWHASVPGETFPNRLFSMAGSSAGDVDQPKGLKIYEGLKTIFDCLDSALKDRHPDDRWGYYFHDFPMLAVVQHHLDALTPRLPSALIRWMTGWSPRVRKVSIFYDRAKKGQLPAVSWIDPTFVVGQHNSDHPPISDLFDGQALVARVYNALLQGAGDVWQKTLFVVVYDEHGGFFDHVAPPGTSDPPPFDRYGVRVPALVASPWIAAGTVDHVIRDHTTILRTILNRFAPGETLTSRVQRAADLDSLLKLKTSRTDATPIAIPSRRPEPRPKGRSTSTPTAFESLIQGYRREVRWRRIRLL